ncbi:MAG: hypothetical protein KGJ13_08195 [Patescibacteria group bacterium]|nr:hypothetical protein [Patescibacteria group bacterium]
MPTTEQIYQDAFGGGGPTPSKAPSSPTAQPRGPSDTDQLWKTLYGNSDMPSVPQAKKAPEFDTEAEALSLAPEMAPATPTSIPYIARGVAAGFLGAPGDIEDLANLVTGQKGTLFPDTARMEEKYLPGKQPTGTDRAYQTLGEFLSPGLGLKAVKTAKAATAATHIGKLGERLASGELSHEALAAARQEVQRQGSAVAKNIAAEEKVAPLEASARGEIMQREIKLRVDQLKAQRSRAANIAYMQADKKMADKFTAGQPWQASPSGSSFLAKIKARIVTDSEKQESSATIRDLRGILSDLEGVQPRGANRVSYSTPKVLRETLRKLRDRANGAPETGFDAISQQSAGTLADNLEESLAQWEPSLSKADAEYKRLSEPLYPTRTARGEKVLKGEEFNWNQLATDPASVPGMFFKTKQGVQQLTQLLRGNKAMVERMAYRHALDELRGQPNPEKWLMDNRDWLNDRNLPLAYKKIHEIVQQESKSIEAGKSLTSAEEVVNHLETTFKRSGIPEEQLVAKIRSVINSKSVEKAIDPQTATKLNEELNAIDRKVARGHKYRAVAKWLGYGVGGYELARFFGLF